MPMSDEARLERLLGGPELARLRQRLRGRYERDAPRDTFTLDNLTAVERRALEALLGRPARSGSSIRISRSELDATMVRAGLAENLRAALEALDGPLINRRADRVERQLAWAALVESVEEPRLRSLVAETAGLAVIKRLAGGAAERGCVLLERARRVLARLPARGIPLAQLAAETLGDAHALDIGQPVAALVLRACRIGRNAQVDAFADGRSGEERVDRIERRREQWARIGVSVNELAAPALCLGVRAPADTPAGRLAAAAADVGQPMHLSLRALLQSPPGWDVAGHAVYVCENPTVVAIAADRLGPDCAPLVCTDGMPATAQQTLLRQLLECGARLMYHGDFDWGGLRIGNFVMSNFGAAPWRFGAAEYRRARTEVEVPLRRGERVEAVWDAELADALVERGAVVHEEAVVETLLVDLTPRFSSSARVRWGDSSTEPEQPKKPFR